MSQTQEPRLIRALRARLRHLRFSRAYAFFYGMGSVLDLFPRRTLLVGQEEAQASDTRKLAGDMSRALRRAGLSHVPLRGWLPDPGALRDIEQLRPGTVERIFEIMEEESASRRERECSILMVRVRGLGWALSLVTLGQIAGFVTALSGILGSLLLVLSSGSWAGSLLTVSTFSFLCLVRLWADRSPYHPWFLRRCSEPL